MLQQCPCEIPGPFHWVPQPLPTRNSCCNSVHVRSLAHFIGLRHHNHSLPDTRVRKTSHCRTLQVKVPYWCNRHKLWSKLYQICPAFLWFTNIRTLTCTELRYMKIRLSQNLPTIILCVLGQSHWLQKMHLAMYCVPSTIRAYSSNSSFDYWPKYENCV